MNKRLLFSFVIIFLIAIMPIIYAESVSDFVQQQITTNSDVKAQVTQDYAGKSLEYLLQNNPEFRMAFRTVIILLIVVALLSIVDIVLRGFAMWRASKNNSKTWFWVLLVVNSLCILPLIYFYISRSKKHKKK